MTAHQQVPMLDLQAQYQTLKSEINAAVAGVFNSCQFVLGKSVTEFETNIANYCSAKHAVGCANGSDAILLALMVLDLKPGDEVILPSFTFFATAGSVSRLGGVPVFAEIDPKTYNICPQDIERKITKKTKAIIPVHLFGQVADMEAILKIANAHKIPVIEDAAQAIGAVYNAVNPSSPLYGKQAGTMGDIGTLSFFPSKNLGGAGDGGMILTENKAFATRLTALRVHGGHDRYFHDEVGINSRLDALQAVVLAVKLKYLDSWHDARAKHADRYNTAFAKHRSIITPLVKGDNKHIYNQYCIRVPDRNKLLEHLQSHKIGCAIYYPLGLHLQECFSELGYKKGDLPVTEAVCNDILALPVYPELTAIQQQTVIDHIMAFVD